MDIASNIAIVEPTADGLPVASFDPAQQLIQLDILCRRIEEAGAKATIFPLLQIVPGPACTCKEGASCGAIGKHPDDLWSKYEAGRQVSAKDGCGHGLATGERSGVFVLDFDSVDAFEKLLSTHEVPATFAVRTSRGVHLYFKYPGFAVRTESGELADKVDVRGDGGMVAAPGSPHKSGGVYEVIEDVPIVAAPTWLLEWPGLRKPPTTTRPSEAAEPSETDTPEQLAEARRKLRLAPKSIEGDGGDQRLFEAAQIAVRSCGLSEETAFAVMTEPGGYNETRCEPSWPDDRIRYKIREARERGTFTTWEETKNFGRLVRRPSAVTEADQAYSFDPCNSVRSNTRDNDGNKIKCAELETNALLFELTRNEWEGVFRHNEFDDRVYAFRPPMRMSLEVGQSRCPDEDNVAIRTWLECERTGRASGDSVAGAVNLIARRNPYHPIRHWLRGLPKPTTRHLDNLAATLLGDDRPIAQDYIRKQLIAACARIFEPGCQVDTTLVLVGPAGGELKSSIIERLFRVPGCNAFRTDLPDIRDLQKIGQALDGVWAVELAELASVRRHDIETMKSFLTRRDERFSPKWIKGEVVRPRQCIFWGTTNEMEFLDAYDSAFRRRFWPVHVARRVDLKHLDTIRAEVWAEAMALYQASEQWWFTDEADAAKGHDGFMAVDPWRDPIVTWLASAEDARRMLKQTFVSTADICEKALGLGKAPSDIDSKHAARVMKALGYGPARSNKVRGWLVPVKDPSNETTNPTFN